MRRAARAIVAAACLILICGRTGLAQPRSRVVCYTAYDTDYLYVAAVVDKPTLQAVSSGPFSDPLHDDCIAVFVDAGQGAPGATRSARSVEMAVSAAGGAQLYRGPNATPLQSFSDFLAGPDGSRVPFKYGVSRRDEAAGGMRQYTVELAIPWIELGGAPETGRRLRFNVVAYSAAADSPALLSMSPAVTRPEDVQNPSLWGEIAFVDSPTKTLASAPQARVCARVMAAKPIIDGAVVNGEWNTLTSFSFGVEGAAGAGAGSPAPARVRLNLPLKRPTPPLAPPAAAPVGSPKRHAPQPWPRLTFALYDFDMQSDPRKALPLRSLLLDDGSYTGVGCPLDGAGPWMTYDRLDWHRGQLEQMRMAGVDVALPVYRAGVEGRAAYAQRGLTVLSGALRSLRAAARPYPMVSMYLVAESLQGPRGEKPDLRTPEGRARLYSAIRDFTLQVPKPFRLSVALSEANGGGVANVAILSNADAFEAVDPEALAYCRARYRAEFGCDLILVGGPGFGPDSGVDAVLPPLRGSDGAASAGPLKLAALSALNDAGGAVARPAARVRLGGSYRAAWKKVSASGADWVVIDSWNDWRTGAAIAPSFLTGLELADITRAFSRMSAGADRSRAACLAYSLPREAPAGATVQAVVRLLNTGATAWTPEAVTLTYRWKASGGSQGAAKPIQLDSVVPPGQTTAQSLSLPAPAQAGEYELILDVVEKPRRGAPVSLEPEGMPLLAAPVRVERAADASAGGCAASLVGTDLPCTAEAGGAYTATVMIRNEGVRSWPRGTTVTARLWRYVSGINSTGESEGAHPVAEMADASAQSGADTAPGQSLTIRVPIAFSTPDGAPLSVSSPSDAWVYLLRWEVRAPDGSSAVTDGEPIALSEMDPGVAIVGEETPPQLPGEKRQPVRLVLRNSGPATWKKEGVRVGYHWYYQDGTPVVWEDETTAIPRDCVPGDEPFEMLAWVTAPPYDGRYFLVWDVKIGEVWASTLPSCRASDTRVRTVDVIGGRLAFVDLTPGYNADGIAPSDNRGDGDFDGAGHALPAELTPPYALAETTPDTLWIASRGTGLESSRRISFRWGSKADKDRNLLIPQGQKVPVSMGRNGQTYSRIHLLAFAVKPDASASCTLQFANGGEQYIQFPVSEWNGAPRFSEPLAYVTSFTYARTPDGFGPPAAIYHYSLKIGDKRKLAALQFGNSPDVRIVAVTLER